MFFNREKFFNQEKCVSEIQMIRLKVLKITGESLKTPNILKNKLRIKPVSFQEIKNNK